MDQKKISNEEVFEWQLMNDLSETKEKAVKWFHLSEFTTSILPCHAPQQGKIIRVEMLCVWMCFSLLITDCFFGHQLSVRMLEVALFKQYGGEGT